MSTASITVIIPCFNSELTIGRAMDSILHQTTMPAQIIFADDASTDNTIKILEKIKNDNPELNINILRLEKNMGPATARNRAWDVANQKYITFLDSDDSWHPQKIELQYNFMLGNPDASLSGHFSKILSKKNYVHGPNIENVINKKISSSQLLMSNKFMTRTVCLKKEIPFRFKEGKRYSEDYLLWLEICLSGRNCYLLEEFLAFSYKDNYGASGLSAHLWKMELGEIATYIEIYKKHRINIFNLFFVSLFSFSKFIKRLITIKFFK